MTASQNRIFQRLIKWAKENKFRQERRQYHIAAIYEKGRLISLSANSTKTHPKISKYYPYPGTGIHAEFGTILMAGLDRDFTNCTIYIIRIDNNNNVAYSAPCVHCAKLLRELKFKKIIHS